MAFQASDFQETKNVNTTGANVMPNTRFASVKLRVVNGPAVSWLLPDARACLPRRTTRLAVDASSTGRIASVVFRDGKRRIGRGTTQGAGLYVADWKARGARRGKHVLVTVVTAASGAKASAKLTVRLCK
jgi:hypothetical protein